MSIDIVYRPEFVRNYRNLPTELKNETKEAIDLFKERDNHKLLKVHKLHGKMKDRYSFSVNFRYRIVFRYMNKNTVALLSLGDHDIYQ